MKQDKTDLLKTLSDNGLLYCWRPGVVAFETSRGRLQIRDRERDSAVELEDPRNSGTLSLLCDLLKRPVALDELEDRAPVPHRAEVRKVLEQLVLLGYVVSDPLSEEEYGRENLQWHHQIRLLGERSLVVAVEQALATINPPEGAVQAIKTDPVTSAPDEREQLFTMARSLIEASHAASEPILFVLAICGDEMEMCQRLSREFAVTGTPYALLRYSGSHFEVGPLVVPGETACFDCMTLRALAAAEEYTAEKEFIRYLSGSNAQRMHLNPPQAMTQLAASMLANELEPYSQAGICSGICNGVWTVYPRPLRLKRHRLLKVPGCPTCALGRRRFLSYMDLGSGEGRNS